MTDLTTTYLGLNLKNPLLVSASPLSEEIDNLRQMEAAGAGAIVLHSLFEEQIELQNLGYAQYGRSGDKKSLPQGLKHVAEMEEFRPGANEYLAHVYQAKRAVNIPIIGSLNGYYSGGWVQYARLIEAAGADALELNVYYVPVKPQTTGSEIEKMYIDLVRNVRAEIKIPVAVKLSPYFSAMTNIAIQLDQLGINGLVLFNRFYQPDFDLETETVIPSLDLSHPNELRLRLRWTALLYQYLQADMAITGGVHSAKDVIKCLFAGARVAMMTSALLRHGITHLTEVLSGVETWLSESEYESVAEIQGRMSQETVDDPAAFERANYLKVLHSRSTTKQE